MRTRSRIRQVVAKAVGILAAAAASEADDAASIQEEEIAADEDARTPDAPHDSEDGGGNISSSVRHDDDEPPPLVCRQGLGTALHPQSPTYVGRAGAAAAALVSLAKAATSDEDKSDDDALTPNVLHDSEDGGGKISACARREGDEPEDGGGKISASVRREDDEPPVLVCRRGPGTTLHPQSPIQGTVNPKSLKFPNMMIYGDRGNTTR